DHAAETQGGRPASFSLPHVLLPLGEKVARETGRMRGMVRFANCLKVSLSLAYPSSERLRRPPSPSRGEGSDQLQCVGALITVSAWATARWAASSSAGSGTRPRSCR